METNLVVGLGNPGKKYKNTPHNLGREVIESIKEKLSFPNFKQKKEILSAVSSKNFGEKKIILAFPLTYMNDSGQSLIALKKFFKVKNQNIIIIHDDIDIDWGKIRINKSRGAAGHHGIESIINSLKTKNFWRIRIGVKPKQKNIIPVEYVLTKFPKDKKKEQKQIIEQTALLTIFYLRKGLIQTTEKILE
ncbi:aminoacyl-tRNA hydrolase [bacterium]|nr:aminoacyl-tRNA hydrolase [bacterium]